MPTRPRILTTSYALAALIGGCVATAAQTATPTVRVLRHLTLIDGTGTPPRPDTTIVMTGAEITAVQPDSTATDWPTAAEVVDLTGCFAVPGLIEAHTHLATAPSRDGYLATTREQLRRLLGHGITTVRDMGGDGRVLTFLARQTLLGELPGPDIHYAAILASPRFFADPRAASASRGREVGSAPWAHIVRADTDLEALMLQVRGFGATGVKLYAGLTPDLVARIVTAAQQHGLAVWGHWVIAPRRTTALATVEAGVQVVSHAHMLMHDASPRERGSAAAVLAAAGGDQLFRTMAQRGTILDATLVAARGLRPPPQWVDPADCAIAIVKAARAAGVRIATGSDRGNLDGLPAIHHEYSLLVERAGLSPVELIEAATRTSAAAIGIADRTGSIEPGKAATLLVLDADPTTDLAALTSPRYVIQRGVAYAGPALRDLTQTVQPLARLSSR